MNGSLVSATNLILKHENHIRNLESQLAQAREEIENLVWNLAGCSTFSMGYGLDESYSKELARPALHDVYKLALKNRETEAKLSKLERVRKLLVIAHGHIDGRVILLATGEPLKKEVEAALRETEGKA